MQKIKNKVPSPIDNRGKHSNRPNKLPASICFQMNTHINNIPKQITTFAVHSYSELIDDSHFFTKYFEK